MASWKESIPRKIRRVSNGSKLQYLISIPASVANSYPDGTMFTVQEQNGTIIVRPVNEVEGNGNVRS